MIAVHELFNEINKLTKLKKFHIFFSNWFAYSIADNLRHLSECVSAHH